MNLNINYVLCNNVIIMYQYCFKYNKYTTLKQDVNKRDLKRCGGEQRREEELSSLLNFSVNINCSKNKVYELKKKSSG